MPARLPPMSRRCFRLRRPARRVGCIRRALRGRRRPACVTGRLRGCDAAFDILGPVFFLCSLCSLRSRRVRPARRAVRSVHPSSSRRRFPISMSMSMSMSMSCRAVCGLGCHHADPAGAARPVPSRPVPSRPVQSNPIQSDPGTPPGSVPGGGIIRARGASL